MSKRRWSLLVGAVGLLAGYVTLAVLLHTPKIEDGVDIGNGWKVRFLAADVGKLNYDSDTKFKSLVRKYAPRWIESQMDQPVIINDTARSKDDLQLALHLWSAKDNQNAIDYPLKPDLELIDSHGIIIHRPYSGMKTHSFGTAGEVITLRESVFPRRDPQLHFRILDSKTKKLLIDKTIPNPGYTPQLTEWVPQPMPITQSVGPVSLTLTGINIHKEQQYLQALSTVTATDPEWERPRIVSSFSDATGNQGHWLLASEPAWKVHTEVRRRDDAKFLPAESWVMPAMDIPGPQSQTAINTTHKFGLSTVTPKWLFGPGHIRIENGKVVSHTARASSEKSLDSQIHAGSGGSVDYLDIETDVPGLLVEYSPLPEQEELLVRVHDQTGRDLLFKANHTNRSGIGGNLYQWIPLQPDATACQIEIIVHKSLEFEFIVQPPTVAEAVSQ